MGIESIIIIAIAVAVVSTIQYNRRKKKEAKQQVVVFCPHCGSEVGLERVRNYICPTCKNTVAYFETYQNINPRIDLVNYNCVQCGTLNFQNVKYCMNCGQEHGPTFRY